MLLEDLTKYMLLSWVLLQGWTWLVMLFRVVVCTVTRLALVARH